MRERKTVKENGLVDAADKFDDIYQRMEALASHAHDLIKYAGDEKLVADWWSGMQDALEKMQSVSGEIRQPNLPGLEPTESAEQDTDQAQVQEEEMKDDNMQETISMLAKLAGLGEAGGHKPDADKDGIPDWADKNPHKAGGDEDRKMESTCPHCHKDPCVCEAVNEEGESYTGTLDDVFNEHDFYELEDIWPALEAGDKDEALAIINGYLDSWQGQDVRALDIQVDPSDVEASKVVWSKRPAGMEEAAKNPYAVGMAQAMKSTGDEPPLKKSTITKAHDIAKAIKKDESVEESLEESTQVEECGLPMMADADQMVAVPAGASSMPELSIHDLAGTQPEEKEVFHLNVKTPNKTMTFVTDDPEEIIRVLRASGVSVEETNTSSAADQYTPPSRPPVQSQGEMNKSMAPTESPKMSPIEASTEEKEDDMKEEKEDDMKESIAALRKLAGYSVVDEAKFGNSVAGAKGDPKVVGDTIDFAMAGTGNAKSGRGDKGLSTFGDNPLGRNDRDLTEDKMMSEFQTWLKEQQESK